MKLALVRACTRSACFELQNNTCYTAPAPFRVQLNGQTVLEACGTNVFSVFSLEPGKTYHLEVLATDGDTGTLDFATAAESFFVDASRYGLVNDGVGNLRCSQSRADRRVRRTHSPAPSASSTPTMPAARVEVETSTHSRTVVSKLLPGR